MEIIPYSRRVNYYETDQMGIVHHSNYLRFFEEARMDLMRQTGCDAMELEKIGIIIPNVDAYAKYAHVMHFGDIFTVNVKPVMFTGVRMQFDYEVVSNGELCCTGYTTHCFVNSDMRPIILKRTNPDVYERLSEVFAELSDGTPGIPAVPYKHKTGT